MLQYPPSTEIAETINELLWIEAPSPPAVLAVADPSSNRITIRASATDMPYIVDIVGQLDRRWGRGPRAREVAPGAAARVTCNNMETEQPLPIVDAKCCKTCVSFDNPSIGHGRCMKRPTTHRIEHNAPRVLVDACNICEWHEDCPPPDKGRKSS